MYIYTIQLSFPSFCICILCFFLNYFIILLGFFQQFYECIRLTSTSCLEMTINSPVSNQWLFAFLLSLASILPAHWDL